MLFGLGSASTARACSCRSPAPPAEAREAAAAVFEGRVISVERGEPAGGPVRVKLSVVRTFGGDLGEVVTVRTGGSSAACGFGFQQDQSYLVYASEHDGQLQVSLCSRTRAMADAAEDLKVLGLGATPVDPHGPTSLPPESERKQPPAQGGCAGCATHIPTPGATLPILLALALLGLRRRR
ncbi:MAG: MYXO-CTERM sorting domain-containing protein [Myxococcales bacterium]